MTATATKRPKLPLVVSATPRATKQARKLGVPGILECRVREQILAGKMTQAHKDGQIAYVTVGDVRVAVQVVHKNGRKAWAPLSCEPCRRQR